MLLGAYSVLLKAPGRFLGGSTLSGERGNWNKTNVSRARFCGEGGSSVRLPALSHLPAGYGPGYGWSMAITAGEMASEVQVVGTGDTTSANLAGGLYADSTITNTGDLVSAALVGVGELVSSQTGSGSVTTANLEATALIAATVVGAGLLTAALTGSGELISALSGLGQFSPNPSMELVVSAVATLSGVGSIQSAALGLIVQGQATLTGTGGFSPNPEIIGDLALSATLAGQGSLTAAMGALAGAAATLIGSGSLVGSTNATVGSMSATITSQSELSPGNLAAAVWNSLVSQFQAAGTMGEALSQAGSGGLSPEFQGILRELWKLAGLDGQNPLVVTSTSRKVPADGSEIDQTITDVAGTVTVQRN